MVPKIEPPPASWSSSEEEEISDKEEYQPQNPETEPISPAQEQEFMEEEEAPNTTQLFKSNFGNGFESKSMEELTQPSNPTRYHPSETQQNEDESQRNKIKISNGDEEDEEKKSAIYKIWSDSDEIALLKGMIDYKFKNGSDPFLEFIKNSLQVDVSKIQLINKIWRLKRKYRRNLKRTKNGEVPIFSKLHEHKSFELSKKIWGVVEATSDDINGNLKSLKRKEMDTVVLEREEPQVLKAKKEDFGSICSRNDGSCLSMFISVEEFVKERMSCLIGSEKAKELKEKWKSLRADEIELYLKRIELIQEQTKLVLAAMKSSSSNS